MSEDSPTPNTKPRIALVTGASSGIGLAVAIALARDCTSVGLVGRDEKRLSDAAAAVRGAGAGAATFVCDLSDAAAIAALGPRVTAAIGSVTILVNNAGIAESSPFLKTSRELWDRTLAIDLTAPFLLTQTFLPGMLERGFGRVIQIASTAAKVGYPYVSAYCAAKHGLLGFTKSLALEVAKKGVTANTVCPGYVDSPMTDRSIANIVSKTGKSKDEARAVLARENPQGRLVTPEEVAACVAFLASYGAHGVNGQTITLDGGATPY